MKYIYLTLAIVLEVLGSSFMAKSEGFTKIVPTLITLLGYGACFYFLSLALKELPLGIAYAIWAGGRAGPYGISFCIYNGAKIRFTCHFRHWAYIIGRNCHQCFL